ncbi:MAG: hypothetical protein WCT14_00970 [Treponemataceae bacterium]
MEGLSIWSPVDIDVGTCVSWKIGNFSLWTERYEQEWHVLQQYSDTVTDSEPVFTVNARSDKPSSSNWKHYLLREGNRAFPVPAMMDRPVVIRPDRGLILLPGEHSHFFLSLPVWFRLLIGKKSDWKAAKPLFEFPIHPMANAWFGDPVSGELCYFTTARLYPDFESIPLSPINVVCPLWISNESDKELPFDRICLHTEFLGIYRGQNRLWTNAVNVTFKGTEQDTLIQASKKAPPHDGAAQLLTEARQTIDNRYFKRTFNLIKSFTGF